ncbi:hypothetical protein GCM10009104_32890 [Marinobacterium maritimum]|uniref:Diguanylate cyclase (GGDEF) domain-containing protein n=1 Tax=Marinobacterium maritimum TaxID=500162 RepID=A0ABN1I9Z7_9GAMM
MWGLVLLVALFMAGLWILSSLNLKYSQQAMAELRQQQIEDGFMARLEQIDTEHRRLEAYADDLVQQAALFLTLRQRGSMSPQDLEQELLHRLQRYNDVFGSGVWYWPGLIKAKIPFAVLAYRSAEGPQLYRSAEQTWQDYRQQIWFPLVLGDDGQAGTMDAAARYWTQAYYNPLTDAAVISLIQPISTADGQVIGLVNVDLHADTLIEYVSRIHMTPGTFAWLIDRDGRRLSSLSQIEDAVLAERTMAAVEQALEAPVQQSDERVLIDVDGRRFELFHARTRGGLVFGVGVPRDEIDAVLAPMRDANRSILWLAGLTILLLSGVILFKVAGLMRELQASYTDELTGLANRARLLQDLQRQRQAALVILDIDRFRELNALFGHDCGDYILTTLTERLQAGIRSDAGSGHSRLYRVGADEFVWLGSEQSHELLETRVLQLLQLVQGLPLQWQGHEFHVSVTLGASSSSAASPEPPPDLISEAQEALKQARQQGVNYQLHDRTRSLEQQFEHNLRWANRLREALRADRLQPWFQPIYSLESGRVEKYECLVRMLDSDGQVISPGLFLDVARQLRLDRQITRLMVEKCCRHFAGTTLQFSINLSYGDLRDESLIGFILEQLDLKGVGPQLIFEILESDGIENYEQVRHFIEQVKKRGCRIAIDDFGTGYSNFEHLLRLDVDLIKIDGSLIRHLHTDPGTRRVVRGIVSFAHSLQIQTVAEFVHAEAVLQQVRALGIDFAQGEVIGMPQPELLE